MASRIKGITVEIGGDTTGLDKALRGVQSTLRTTQSSLRDVNKLLKLDPSNTELLTQKQKLLKDAIGTTKEKLDALKQAQKQAGTALRTVMSNLSGDFTVSGKSIGDVTIATTNADGSMRSLSDILKDTREAFSGLSESEKAQAAEMLVGKNAMSGFLALMNAAPADIDKLSGGIANCDGSAEKMADTMQDNLAGQLTILKSQLQELAISFGEILMPAIRSIVSKLQGFIDKLNGMDDKTKETIIKIALLAAAIGPLLIVVGKSMATIGTAMKGFSALAGKIALLSTNAGGAGGILAKLGAAIGGILAPVLAVAAVIAALVAAFAHLWKTNEGFRKAIIGTWNEIRETVSGFCQVIVDRLNALGFNFTDIVDVLKTVWDNFCKLLAPLFEGVFKNISIVLKTVLDVLTGILDVFIGLFTGNWEHMWTGIKEIFFGVWNGITAWFGNILSTLKGVADVVLGWFGTSWNEVWTGIRDFFAGIWNGITTFFTTAWETLKNIVQTGILFIGAIIQGAFDIITLPFRFIWENCKGIIVAVWDAIKEKITVVIDSIKTVISTVLTAIQTIFSTVWGAIQSVVTTVVNIIKNVVTTVFGAIKEVTSAVWNTIKSVITTVIDGIKNKVSTVFNAVKTTVTGIFNSIKSVTTSIWNGIKSAIVTPIEKARDIIKGIVDKIKGFFSGLHISLPHIKLPHFSIQGSFSLAPPSVPHLSIDWYKKAMNQPMLLNGATIFGRNGNTLLGGGEAGPEVIMGLDTLNSMTAGSNRDVMTSVQAVLSMMAEYFPQFANASIMLDSGEMVGAMAPKLNTELGRIASRQRKGW